ncbi:MAG: hypothetical protein Q9219_002454 [cf. Caloplaca sp. 3 TL-2023]
MAGSPALGSMALPQSRKLTGRSFYESLGSPKYILAPMAWRLLTRSFVPPEQRSSLIAYTPMLHARLFKETQSYRDHHFQPTRTGLPSPPRPLPEAPSDKEQRPYLDGHTTHDRPLIVQFCANDPDDLLQAAKYVAPYCDAVDLNLGCPQGIARKGHYGSFLQESPELIRSLVSKLAENLEVPVTAKMRVLDTKENTLRHARLLLDAGASWIGVHGRRREQKGHETGLADWSVIRYLRDMLPKDTVIFANGNVLGYRDLDRCLEVTGADGVMSAEGNLCDPGIFAGEQGRSVGLEAGEYWKGRDGKGGWRMDAVMTRYLDILYHFVLERNPPNRQTSTASDQKTQPVPPDNTADPPPQQPPLKKRKYNRPTSPNLLAVQAHLFHLLRPLLSIHTHIRDKLAHARPGDMSAYEEILAMVKEVTRQGLQDYERDPSLFDFPLREQKNGVEVEQEEVEKEEEEYDDEDEDERTSSKRAVRECYRPWWVCQAYVRPLPNEALKKGSLSLGKKEQKKREKEAETLERETKRKEEELATGRNERENRDEMDGVPREEIPKEAMVCG